MRKSYVLADSEKFERSVHYKKDTLAEEYHKSKRKKFLQLRIEFRSGGKLVCSINIPKARDFFSGRCDRVSV